MSVVSGLIGGATGLVSGIIGSNAAKSAAEQQVAAAREASNQAAQATTSNYGKGIDAVAPWLSTGKDALNALWSKVQAGPGTYSASDLYKLNLDTGTKAIERSAAAKGNVLSGKTIQGLQTFSQDLASKDYQNWLANYYNSLSPYASLSSSGQNAANTTANLYTGMANALAGNYLGTGQQVGNAQAAGTINAANAWTGGIQSGVNNALLMNYLGGSSNPFGSSTWNPTASQVDSQVAYNQSMYGQSNPFNWG